MPRWCGRRDSNPGRRLGRPIITYAEPYDERMENKRECELRIDGLSRLLVDFKEFCKVDLQLADRTVMDHVWRIKHFLKAIDVKRLSKEDIRSYLMGFTDGNKNTYSNVLKALKVFCRDFLGRPWLVDGFRFPPRPIEPKVIPNKEQLKKFYNELDLRDRALFLLYATSGLRKSEVLSLGIQDINLEKRMIKPKKEEGSRTKKTWIAFFNKEAEESLKNYLATRHDKDPRLFQMGPSNNLKTWKKAHRKTGIHITPQVLREWFACEMGRLGVPDRYVDAFCGRVPRSILARHYTDFSPERLKEIYDKANLRVLNRNKK